MQAEDWILELLAEPTNLYIVLLQLTKNKLAYFNRGFLPHTKIIF